MPPNTRFFVRTVARVWQILSHPDWLWDVGVRGRPLSLGNVAPKMPPGAGIGEFWKWVGANFDASVTWKELDWIRQCWKGPLIIKDVLDVEDARQAAALGADGIVVSNHGGRQLDGALSGVRALPPIVDAVGDRLTVLMDGGVRSGLDVVRALAADGGCGVARMLKILAQEMRVAMVLTGHRTIGELDSSTLAI